MSTTTLSNATDTGTLRQAYAKLQEEQPRLRIRDAATELGSSEAQLLSLECGKTVTRLAIEDWAGFMSELKALGRVMVLTRNEHCVHERSGCYENIQAHGGKIGLVTGKDIDLRLFYSEWALAYSVESTHGERVMRSFQFFDAAGQAIHKVYLKNEEGLTVFQELTERFKAEDQSPEQAVSAPAAKPEEKEELTELGRASFVSEWAELKDTHDFFILLKKHQVSRLCAMKSAEGSFTKKVDNEISTRMLHAASEKQVPIMVFVGNEGAIQIHTGPVNKIMPHGEWINVLDPDFNLHLKTPGIASSWIVEKPTKDGTVTSLETYDADGELIAQFFGARKPGIPEREDWRELLASLQN